VLLRNLYKSVVYGLAVKYSATEPSLSAQGHQGSSTNRTLLDVQDALLADRLKCHLTLQGEDINMIVFEVEKMDNPKSSTSVPIPIMSYERLVSFILLSKNLEGRSKTARKGSDRFASKKKPPSRLAESFSIE